MKVYISGPIAGTIDYMERFAEAEERLTREGNVVINPAKVGAGLPRSTTHKEHMKMAICMLSMCDAIFLMDGWSNSAGCNEEVAYALKNKIMITYEGGK